MFKTIKDIHKNLELFKPIPVEKLNMFMISKDGLLYNTLSKKFLKPHLHKNTKLFSIHLFESQYQIKHLLYITFVNPEYDFEGLTNVKSKFMINIKNTNDNLPYINFNVEDLELITKSDKIKKQERNNRIINKYDNNKQFIQSYNDIEDIKKEFNIKYNKYITLACGKNKNKLYNNYYFRYDDDDEIKNPDIIGSFNKININEELNEETKQEIDLKPEEWKRLLSDDEYNEYYQNYEISNYGNFRNYNNKQINKLHKNCGYLYASINIYNPTTNNKKVKKIRVNILVAKYFLTQPETYDKLVVDHIDGNKLNNYFENLQYLTYSENKSKG